MAEILGKFCKYCGSHNLVAATVDQQNGRSSLVNPSLNIQTPAASIGISAGSFGSNRLRRLGFTTPHCRLCFNQDVSNTLEDYRPMSVKSTDGAYVIIIPHSILVVCSMIGYRQSHFHLLAQNLTGILIRIHKKWLSEGRNPCKKKRVGYKIIMPLLNDYEIRPWIIVDDENGVVAFRICYGGTDIVCP